MGRFRIKKVKENMPNNTDILLQCEDRKRYLYQPHLFFRFFQKNLKLNLKKILLN